MGNYGKQNITNDKHGSCRRMQISVILFSLANPVMSFLHVVSGFGTPANFDWTLGKRYGMNDFYGGSVSLENLWVSALKQG
jgi:hypothetical protein